METGTLGIVFHDSAPYNLKLQVTNCLPPLNVFSAKPELLHFCKPLRRIWVIPKEDRVWGNQIRSLCSSCRYS